MTQSTKKVSAATAAIAVVILAIWYMALFRPQSSNLHKANAAYSAAEAQATKLQAQITSLEALKRQIPQDTAKLSQLNLAVPKAPDLQDILTQLHALAVSAGVELTNVNPSIPAAGGSSATANQVQLSMSASGGYSQLRAFLTGLDSLQRVIVVTQLSVGGSGSSLTASITSHMFYAP